jgi:cysteine desulfurase
MRQLYFDHNTTTPLAPTVQQAMLPLLAEQFGSPGGSCALARAANEAVEDAREHVSALLGCDPEEIVFTGGGTESNNLAIKGVAFRHEIAAGGHLIISAIEHASVVESARFLERLGFDVSLVRVLPGGTIQPNAVRQALRDDTLLVSVMLANHETGAIQPIKAIADICHAAGVPLHTDASQAIGKMRVNVEELSVDLLSIAGHKFYAPKGVGALYVRQGTLVEPLLHGEQQEAGLRSGTENVAGIAGLGAAACHVNKNLDAAIERMAKLSEQLLATLRTGVEGLILHAEKARRLPNTLCVSFPDVLGQRMLARVPELSAWAAGSASSHADAMSATLGAMGVDSEIAHGTLRLSLGWYTTEEDVARAASLLVEAWEALRFVR